MTLDTAAVNALRDQVISHAQTLGVFDKVANHEPKNAPGNGLFASIWAQTIDPLPEASGLIAVTGRVVFHVRIETNMYQEPQDDIDGQILRAAATLMAEYSGHFTLGGNVRNVDMLGAHGEALRMQAGYLEIDRKLYRTAVVVLPVIVNDMYGEAG